MQFQYISQCLILYMESHYLQYRCIYTMQEEGNVFLPLLEQIEKEQFSH